jgi:hypothetical protein
VSSQLAVRRIAKQTRCQATRFRVPYAYKHRKEGNTTPCTHLGLYTSHRQIWQHMPGGQLLLLKPESQAEAAAWTEGSAGVNYGKDSRVIQLGYDNTNFGRCINDVASQSCKASSLPKAIHANYSKACSCTRSRCQPCACTIVSSAARLHFFSNT